MGSHSLHRPTTWRLLLSNNTIQTLVGRLFDLKKIVKWLGTALWVAFLCVNWPFWENRALNGVAFVVSTCLEVGLHLVLVFLLILFVFGICCFSSSIAAVTTAYKSVGYITRHSIEGNCSLHDQHPRGCL